MNKPQCEFLIVKIKDDNQFSKRENMDIYFDKKLFSVDLQIDQYNKQVNFVEYEQVKKLLEDKHRMLNRMLEVQNTLFRFEEHLKNKKKTLPEEIKQKTKELKEKTKVYQEISKKEQSEIKKIKKAKLEMLKKDKPKLSLSAIFKGKK